MVASLLLRRRRLSADHASMHVSAAEFQGQVVGAEIGNKRSTIVRTPDQSFE
jgi:hypothetical protein